MTKTIAILVYPQFQILDAVGPTTVFELADQIEPGHYERRIISMDGGTIVSSSGVALSSERAEEIGPVDTLIAVGGNGFEAAMTCPRLHAYLRARAADSRRICSVCSGAFLLAAAGLLDGRAATTHWRRAERLRSLFPQVRLDPDRIHVRDGPIWTSAGISAGIDLALALLAADRNEAVARRVAQEMVVYYRRPGGQSQFSVLAELGGDATIFSPLLDWIRGHLDQRLGVERLAEQMGMSPRNFARAFTRAMGISPAKAVERLRLETARERVEHGAEPIEQIAHSIGFSDPERMRRAFLRHFGQPPQALRRARRP